MIYSKETYLKLFKSLKPKLVKEKFSKFAHCWYSDGLFTAPSDTNEEFFSQPDPEENEKVIFWEPCFRCWKKDSKGFAYLEGHLEDDGSEPYWVMEINYYKKEVTKRKGRSPVIVYNIREIMEENIKDIPSLIKKINN